MADLPSFLDKTEFVGAYLPGYVLVIGYVILYQPSLVLVVGSSAPSVSADLLSSILFLVAGPAAGITLRQSMDSILAFRIRFVQSREIARDLQQQDKEKRKPSKQAVEDELKKGWKKTAIARLRANPDQNATVNESKALYDFGLSTGLAFFLLGLYGLLLRIHVIISFLLFLGGVILWLGSHFEDETTLDPRLKALKDLNPPDK